MNLEKQIYHRKSCRNYSDKPVNVNEIHNFIETAKPLIDSADYDYKILTPEEVKVRAGWKAPYYLALYAKKQELALENIGFIFQQLSLYLQSIDIGSCWVGMDSPKQKSDDFVIIIAFGYSDKMTRDENSFKRKKLSEISDNEDEKLIPAQLAPSAMNSQPWYFKHTDDGFDVYQVKQNLIKRQMLKNWNRIDMGITLAHLYVSNPETFEFYRKNDFEELKGYTYTGSIKI